MLPDRSDRRAVAHPAAPGPAGRARWPPARGGHARGPERGLLPRPGRGVLADAAARPAALGDGPLLLSPLAAGRGLAADARCLAREGAAQGGPEGHPERGDSRQPEREDDGKKGPRGYVTFRLFGRP